MPGRASFDIPGFVAVTDLRWFEFLQSRGELDEVDFWRPSAGSRVRLAPGTPFFFKLHEGDGGRIVGFGLFAHYSPMPAWKAWEDFEQKNGAAEFGQFLRTLTSYRRGRGVASDPAGQFDIGCVLLATPVFFPREQWIAPPSDWAPNIVAGKGYDLARGEGARIWRHCQEVAFGMPGRREAMGFTAELTPAGYGAPRLMRPRLGQGIFRAAVTDAYGRACAVTTEHSLPVLEAAHIKPFASEGPHEIANGLLLRTDIHRLFDRGYVTVTPEHRFEVSHRLRDDYENGRTYYALHGSAIRLPRELAFHPSREYLEWHAREVFRG